MPTALDVNLAAHSDNGADDLRLRLDALDAENECLSATLAVARAELETTRAELERQRGETEQARAEMSSMSTEFETAMEELRQEYTTAVGEQALACTSLPLDGLLTAFTSLERASSTSELLTTVVGALSREFSRVALFRVRNRRIEGAHQVGYGFSDDISKLAFPTSVDSLLTRAFKSGQLECVLAASGDSTVSLPFGGTPACAVAMPFALRGGEPLAIVYADDSDAPGFDSSASHMRMKFAELLRRYARLLLERAAAAGAGLMPAAPPA